MCFVELLVTLLMQTCITDEVIPKVCNDMYHVGIT